jgi:alkanesulfonate monooxygenase SsuD/methylene tetrahydromethanopterin reductase-like flavin-dependent oxidoreductase (luciferase family)
MSATLLVGLGISTSAAAGADPLRDALTAEALGFDFVSASDHPVGADPSYETATLLAWLAARTSRITVVSRVLGVPFRRPAVVAKSVETLHRLSGGRVILGLGAGYSDAEIRALGGRDRSPGEKVTGLGEAIEIILGAWARPSFNFTGSVHSVVDLTLTPRPAAPIPIWLGTFGRRALAVTGRLADGWIPSYGHAPPARIPEMRERIRAAAVAAGRDPDSVRCVYNVPVRISPRPADQTVTGSVADVVDQLRELTALGFGGVNLMPDESDRARQTQLLGAEVLPALRG